MSVGQKDVSARLRWRAAAAVDRDEAGALRRVAARYGAPARSDT